jgi:threonine/homoserine efflux transporter RhtA
MINTWPFLFEHEIVDHTLSKQPDVINYGVITLVLNFHFYISWFAIPW